MARISKLRVSESVQELKILLRKESYFKNIPRLQALINIKENKFRTREELGDHLGVKRRTIEKWLSDYRLGGLDKMMLSGKRNRKSSMITEEIHKGLEQKVMDREQGFSSYVEAQNWIALEYDVELKYNTVREHLIRHFKTKIKSPRKSHVNKDNKAVETFLKTA